MSSRVNIEGQFNYDSPLSSCNTENVVIDRHVTLISVPRNWTTFCADADETLQAIAMAKSFYRIFGTLFMAAAIAAYVFLILGYVAEFDTFGFSNSIFFYLLFLVVLIPSVVTSLVTKTKVSSVMENLERVCLDHSGDGFRYVLCNERWGAGCNGNRAKRYFVTVLVIDAELATGTSTNFENTASLPVATPVSWPTASTSAYTTTVATPVSSLPAASTSAANTTTAYDPQPSAPSAPAPGTSMFDQFAR